MVEIKDNTSNRLSEHMMAVAENVEGLVSEVAVYNDRTGIITLIISLYLAGPINEGDIITIPISSILAENNHESGRRIESVIAGPWEFSFVVTTEMPEMKITVFPENENFTGLEIECSPMTTTILKHINESIELKKVIEFIENHGSPFLTLINGENINLEPTGSIFHEDIGWSGYATEYFDISLLFSITFCGEEYIFN